MMKVKYIARFNRDQTAFSKNKKVEHLIKCIPGKPLEWFGRNYPTGWKIVDVEYSPKYRPDGNETSFLKLPNYVEITEETFIKLCISPNWDFTCD